MPQDPTPSQSTPLVPGYQVLRLAGSGGMSGVYEAVDEKLNRKVAIKILHPHLLGDDTAQARFKREALAAAKMDHPNVVRIYDYISDPNFTAIVMEYVPGMNMETLVKSHGPLPFDSAMWVAYQVALALREAHANQIIHRDVKPSNILLRHDDRIMLSDFGLAHQFEDSRLTITGTVAGTPQFMSPEQVAGSEMSQSSDVYSWAVTLHYLMSGNLPYSSTEFAEILGSVKEGKIVLDSQFRSRIPSKGLELVQQCLQPAPKDRLTDAEVLVSEIEKRFALKKPNFARLRTAAGPSRAGSESSDDDTRSMVVAITKSKEWRLALLLSLVALILISLGGAGLHQFRKARRIAGKSPLPEKETQMPDTNAAEKAPAKPTPRDPLPTPKARKEAPALPPPHSAPKDSGKLFIFVEPWARVFVDNREMGKTPLGGPMVLIEGIHRIRLENDFCEPETDTIRIAPGRVIRRRYKLQLKPAYR